MILQVLVFVAGMLLVAWTLLSAVRTVILPRGESAALTLLVFRPVGQAFRFVANRRRTYLGQDRVMALYAPVALSMLPGVWVAFVLVGFLAMFWGVGGRDVGEAFFVSGSSLLTLGFAQVDGVFEQLLAFAEATLGLGIVALMITFLPSIYSAFSRREAMVGLLEVRAGSPPSAAAFVIRHHRIGWLDRLSDRWADWERWFVDIEESHLSYPALVFFRSSQPDLSWITAAGAILDSAAMTRAAVDVADQPAADLAIRAGYLSLRRICDHFGITYDPVPDPGDPISVTRAEFEGALDDMAEAGVPIKPDRDQAWRDFAGWRVNYDAPLLGLAQLVMAPFAPWASDRSSPTQNAETISISRWRRRVQPFGDRVE